MEVIEHKAPSDLREYGLRNLERINWNLEPAALIELALRRREGHLARNGAFVVRTGQFTGRSPKDKYIVMDESTSAAVNWGAVNQPMHPDNFDRIYNRMTAFLETQALFVQDCFGGADPEYRLPIRVITQRAWHSLFARQLFIRPTTHELAVHV